MKKEIKKGILASALIISTLTNVSATTINPYNIVNTKGNPVLTENVDKAFSFSNKFKSGDVYVEKYVFDNTGNLNKKNKYIENRTVLSFIGEGAKKDTSKIRDIRIMFNNVVRKQNKVDSNKMNSLLDKYMPSKSYLNKYYKRPVYRKLKSSPSSHMYATIYEKKDWVKESSNHPKRIVKIVEKWDKYVYVKNGIVTSNVWFDNTEGVKWDGKTYR